MALLSKRVALVTGGSRGIGRAVAISLADAGASVAVNYRERAAEARDVVEIIRGAGGQAMAVGGDVSMATEVSAIMAAVEHELGPVDVLVNNAGVGLVRGIDDLTEDDFDLTIAVNLKSAFLCTQAVVPGMRARKWGRIVNISSGAARGAGGVGPHYNASKAGMEGLTRGYAARLRSRVISRANPAGPVRHRRGVRAGRADGHRQRLYDGADDRAERRDVVHLSVARTARLQPRL